MPAFSLIMDAAPVGNKNRVFVVRQPDSHRGRGKWMLPGGNIERGDTPYKTAVKELEEEAGFKIGPHSDVSIIAEEIVGMQGASFFKGTFPFSEYTKQTIQRIFNSRTTPHETIDWAYVVFYPGVQGEAVIEDHDGNRIARANWRNLRGGTDEGIQLARENPVMGSPKSPKKKKSRKSKKKKRRSKKKKRKSKKKKRTRRRN